MNLADLKCPYCGKCHAQYHYSTSTCMGWATIIKDGQVVSQNPNIQTSYYTCLECRHKFSVQEQYGEVIKVTDDGLAQVVPVVNVPINAMTADGATTIATDVLPINVQMSVGDTVVTAY